MDQSNQPNEIIYLDEVEEIKRALAEQQCILVVDNSNSAKTIRNGLILDSDAARTQADWSIAQGRFSPFLSKYIKMFSGYEQWDETLPGRTVFSKQDKQLIGLIELLAGTWTQMKHSKRYTLILIEEPETHVHPKQQQELWSVIMAIYKDCAI